MPMSNESIWKNIQEELKLSISKTHYQTLFSSTQLVSLEKEIATIGCPSSYIREMIESRYYSLLKEILDRQTGKNNER